VLPRIHIPDDISIGSAFFAAHTQTARQTTLLLQTSSFIPVQPLLSVLEQTSCLEYGQAVL